ncbi:MAG: tRNA (adenosine(37)-N6)-threonylcarbamoyltransferase complex ATPase subunit type 1 TsaE [Pseudomonadota bacterium]
MSNRKCAITLQSEEETTAFARQLAGILTAGDVLLLDGPVGTGKTHFARSLILALLPQPEDVPSPTFTLVQTYAAKPFEIWHADLYRLTDSNEVIELGLTDAFDTALCLVEWPDRLSDLTPDNALTLAFATPSGDDRRIVTATWRDPRWDERLGDVLND